MPRKIMVLGAAALATAGLSACGDHSNNSTSTTTPPMTQQLDTAAVLALAQKSSEVSQPIAVDDGAVSITDTSDTTEPISVDAM